MAHPFLDHPGPIPFAHRGGASEVPENTLPAFQHAVDLGYRYVETDVHATRDGVLLAFHDDRLDRVTDRAGLIADLTYDEIRDARVDGVAPIPRFEELLDTFPSLRINVDPKADSAVAPLTELLRRRDELDRICVGSFSDRRIATLRRALGPELCTSAGPRQFARLVAAARGLRIGGFDAMAVQIPFRQRRVTVTTERVVKAAHDRGIDVHVWTIDDPAEMVHLLDIGVDGLMTDRPVVLKDVLVGRGEWH